MGFPRVFSLQFKSDKLIGAGHVERVSGFDETFYVVGDESLRDALRSLPEGPRKPDVEQLVARSKGWHAGIASAREIAWFAGNSGARLTLGGDVLVGVGCEKLPAWARELAEHSDPQLLRRLLASAGLRQAPPEAPSEIYGSAVRAPREDAPQVAAGRRVVRPLEIVPQLTLGVGVLALIASMATLTLVWQARPRVVPPRGSSAAAPHTGAPTPTPNAGSGAQDDARDAGSLCDVLPDDAKAARAYCRAQFVAPPGDVAFLAARDRALAGLTAARAKHKALPPPAREAWSRVVAALHARLLLTRWEHGPTVPERLDVAKPYETALKALSDVDLKTWSSALDTALATPATAAALWGGEPADDAANLRAQLIRTDTLRAPPELLKAAEAASR